THLFCIHILSFTPVHFTHLNLLYHSSAAINPYDHITILIVFQYHTKRYRIYQISPLRLAKTTQLDRAIFLMMPPLVQFLLTYPFQGQSIVGLCLLVLYLSTFLSSRARALYRYLMFCLPSIEKPFVLRLLQRPIYMFHSNQREMTSFRMH